jgi:hypothetical protein
MHEFVYFLEPIFYDKCEAIVNELDEFGEINFIQSGLVGVGYEINKKKKYPVQYLDGIVIGAFGVTFDQRASFIYYSASYCKGYFIRKLRWKLIMSENPEICECLKKNILTDYLITIRIKIMVEKKKDLEKLMKRKDHQEVMTIETKKGDKTRDLLRDAFEDNLLGS